MGKKRRERVRRRATGATTPFEAIFLPIFSYGFNM